MRQFIAFGVVLHAALSLDVLTSEWSVSLPPRWSASVNDDVVEKFGIPLADNYLSRKLKETDHRFRHAASIASAEAEVENELITEEIGNFKKDLSEVRRTYENIKEKWNAMLAQRKEKPEIRRFPLKSTTMASTSRSEDGVDVFDDINNFVDISADTEDFKNDNVDDISSNLNSLAANSGQNTVATSFIPWTQTPLLATLPTTTTVVTTRQKTETPTSTSTTTPESQTERSSTPITTSYPPSTTPQGFATLPAAFDLSQFFTLLPFELATTTTTSAIGLTNPPIRGMFDRTFLPMVKQKPKKHGYSLSKSNYVSSVLMPLPPLSVVEDFETELVRPKFQSQTEPSPFDDESLVIAPNVDDVGQREFEFRRGPAYEADNELEKSNELQRIIENAIIEEGKPVRRHKKEEVQRCRTNERSPTWKVLKLKKLGQISKLAGMKDLALTLRESSLFEMSNSKGVSAKDKRTRSDRMVWMEAAIAQKKRLVGHLKVLLALANAKEELREKLERQETLLQRLTSSTAQQLQLAENVEAAMPSLNVFPGDVFAAPHQQVPPSQANVNEEKDDEMEAPELLELEMEARRRSHKTRRHGVVPFKESKPFRLFARQHAPSAHRVSNEIPLTPLIARGDEGAEEPSVHELIDMLHEDLGDDGADGSVACRRVECNFEQGNLCNFESSHDEATRIRRQADDEEVDELAVNDGNVPLLLRSWSIWMGRRASTQQSIDAGLIFSNTNQQFAAVFLEPQQTGLLSITLNNPKRATVVRFRIFEATRGMRLKVCCDQSCPVQTEWGLYRGHRHWLKKTIVCPKTTKQLTFECSNQGQHRGACGVDDVFLVSSSCRRLFKGNDDA